MTSSTAIIQSLQDLAINGGTPVRATPWPKRHLFGAEEKAAALRLFDRAAETGEAFGYHGEEEEAYCREFCASLGEPNGLADAVNSGSSAVYVALRALELRPLDEVIVPPVTDPGGVMPVPMIGCIPVVADAAPHSYNLGAKQIAARLSPRTKAIIVAHIAGTPADMAPIMELARSRKIAVIEDCAQAHGATYRGRPAGTIGDIGVFSTMSGKHHATAAQGGIVFTKDPDVYWRVRRYADRGKPFGIDGQKNNLVASLNLNSNELACAIGREQLKKLPRIVSDRRRFAGMLVERCASELRAIRALAAPDGAVSSYWFMFFTIDVSRLSADRATVVRAIAAEGIPVEAGYAYPVAQANWFAQRAVFGDSGWPWTDPLYAGDRNPSYQTPNLLEIDARSFRLSMHERCGEGEADDVIAALKKVEHAFAKTDQQPDATKIPKSV